MTEARRRTERDQGSITVFTAVVCLGLLALSGLVVDGGEALAAKTRALGQAEDAARAGAQALDLHELRQRSLVSLDPAMAEQDARTYLAAQNARGTVRADRLQVTVTVTVSARTLFLGLVGVHALTMTATGTARATSASL